MNIIIFSVKSQIHGTYIYDEARIPINTNDWMYQEPPYMLIYSYLE